MLQAQGESRDERAEAALSPGGDEQLTGHLHGWVERIKLTFESGRCLRRAGPATPARTAGEDADLRGRSGCADQCHQRRAHHGLDWSALGLLRVFTLKASSARPTALPSGAA
jgi:hypothetical protein